MLDFSHKLMIMDRDNEPPSKKPRKSKVKTSKQRFRPEYTHEWPVLMRSKLDDFHVYCTVCKVDRDISHGGRDDCRRHMEGSGHIQRAKAISSHVGTITNLFSKSFDYKVIEAETLFTNFLVEHNIPLAVADHATPLFQRMFPDSSTAKKYACKRTKTSCIVRAQGTRAKSEIASRLQEGPYAVSTDGSNDTGSDPLYPLVVRSFDDKAGMVKCELLSLPCNRQASTGKGIFDLVSSNLEEVDVTWESCIAFGSDNASVMSGKKNGVLGHIMKEHPHVFFQGCPCHLIHLAAEKAASKLPFSVEELLIYLYYCLDKSSKRHQELKSFQELYSPNTHKILKYASTRWLSLGQCVARLLEQWDALAECYKPTTTSSTSKAKSQSTSKGNSSASQKTTTEPTTSKSQSATTESMKSKQSGKEKTPTSRLDRLISAFSSKKAKLYCLFLDKVIHVFDIPNTYLQKEEPLIHVLNDTLEKLLSNLLVRFVKPESIAKAKSLLDLDYSRKNQKSRDSLVLGAATRQYIARLKETSPEAEVKEILNEFYPAVREFFSAACEYIIKKFPINDPVLKNASVADVSKRLTSQYSSLEYFIERFPCLLQKCKLRFGEAAATTDRLEEEFLQYQVEKDLLPGCDSDLRADKMWHEISKLIDPQTGREKYQMLAMVMEGILVIPHSNAESERIFSMVRKNRTSFRPNLDNQTLEALLVGKVCSQGVPCYERKFTEEELRHAKYATARALSGIDK